MAASKLPSSLLYTIFLSFLLHNTISSVSVPLSLSTVSISQASNITVICALVPHSVNKAVLNCTTLPTSASARSFAPYPKTEISAITGGNGFQCFLRTSATYSVSSLSCLRFNHSSKYKRIYNGPVLEELVAGNSHVCGRVSGTNRIRCWQWSGFDDNYLGQSLHGIAVGGEFVCGLSKYGTVECFGNDTAIVGGKPPGKFSYLGAGLRHACGISLDGGITCWGDTVRNAPAGEFTSLALGDGVSCGVRTNHSVACWGENSFRVPESLVAARFLSIEAKGSVFCGICMLNYSLYCFDTKIFDTISIVFERIQPGPCQSECPCGFLSGSGSFCKKGAICQSCPKPIPPTGSPPALHQSSSSGRNASRIAFVVVGCVGTCVFVMVLTFFLFRYCKQRSRVHDSGRSGEVTDSFHYGSTRERERETPLPCLETRISHVFSQCNGGQLEEFSLQELLFVTKNFSEDHKIGYGSFGSVYRATLVDGREVAIKRAELTCWRYGIGTKRQDDKENAFLSELSHLSRVNHKNLVKLYGFCEEIHELVLVYEFLSNGTLNEHLHKLEDSPLKSWDARLKVALDAARGIEYLHRYVVPSIIHRDIKSSNILLDSTWTAKVADFGLSLMGPGEDETHLSLRAAGTVGYMDPEYYRLQQLTAKSDVYSFGVVLLELLSGYKAIHPHENGAPRNVVDFILPYIEEDQLHHVLDPKLPPPTPHEIESVIYVGYLAADCVSLEGRDRPSMTEIVSILEGCLAACGMQPSLSRSATTRPEED